MKQTCLFCRIARHEAPAEFLYADEQLVVFKDIHPKAPVHLLIVPVRHIRSVNDLVASDGAIVAKMVATARDMAEQTGISKSGYKLFFNVEKGGGQVIFHLHLHLIGGW